MAQPADSGLVVAPASLAQRREFAYAVDGRAWRNGLFGWTVAARWDRERFCEALTRIVERHEALRSSLQDVDDTVLQSISDRIDIELTEVQGGGGDTAATVDRLEDELLARPFALDQTPLWRCGIVDLGAHGFTLAVVAAHAIWDARSTVVFSSELAAFYRPADVAPSLVCLPDALQSADLAAWEDQAGDPQAEDHWRRVISSARSDIAPGVRRSAQPFVLGVAEIPKAPPWVRTALMRLARSQGCSLHTVLLGAFILAVHDVLGVDTVRVGVAGANRDVPGAEGVVANLISYVPLAVEVRGDASLAPVVGDVRRLLFTARSHPLPLPRIAGLAAAASRFAWDVTFNFRPAGIWQPGRRSDPGAAIAPHPERYRWQDFPVRGVWWEAILDLNADEGDDGSLSGEVTFDPRVLDAAAVARVIERYRALLES